MKTSSMFNPVRSKGKRIPSLDGLRALSIALVIIGHAYQGKTGTSPNTTFWLIFGNAALGVEIFFVISGYLITTLLVNEFERENTISLKNFYLRRVFRILPALWVYVAAIVLLSVFGVLGGVTSCSVYSSLTFLTNYMPCAASLPLGHTWSLSVEEQYYLLWPAVLLLTLRRNGRTAAIKLTLTLIVLSPVIRVVTHFLGNQYLSSNMYYMLHTRMDALMFGCLLALASGSKMLEKIYNIARGWLPLAVLFTLVLSPLAINRFGGAYLYIIGYSIEGVSIALALLWLVRNPDSYVGRVFNTPPIIYMGVISYSLYLWQELLLKTDIALAKETAIALIITFIIAAASYEFIEKPILKVSRRFIGKSINICRSEEESGVALESETGV